MTLDDARAARPDLGFALYALEPGQPVTLEIMDGDQNLFTFKGATEAECLARAFPREAQFLQLQELAEAIPDKPAPPAPTLFD